MNIITDRLPTKIGEYEVMPDFRNMIRLQILLHDPDGWGDFETALALSLLYPKKKREDGTEYVDKPADIHEAMDGLRWFLSRGEGNDGDVKGKKSPEPYDFEQDADDIISAFWAVYGINLARVPLNGLHWWEFLTLFRGLPDDTAIKKKIYIRTVDLNEIKDKREKQRIQKLRRLCAIKRRRNEPLTKEQIEQNTLSWADSILPRNGGQQ